MRTFDKDELRKRVDEILFYVWDPIGVSPEPCARGEYNNYVSEVLQLLQTHETATPITAHLANIVQSRMELTPDLQKCHDVAYLLLEHKRAVKQGLA